MFDETVKAWKAQYFALPALWNAFQEGITADSSEGTIEQPDGGRIHWLAGSLVGSELSSPRRELLWKRVELDQRMTLGVLRDKRGRDELQIEIRLPVLCVIVFSTEASNQERTDEVVGFARSLRSEPWPCRECVRPIPRNPGRNSK